MLCVHLHVRPLYLYVDLAIASDARLGRITEGVLIARFSDRGRHTLFQWWLRTTSLNTVPPPVALTYFGRMSP